MLNGRLIALAAAIVILGAGTQASAFNVSVSPSGLGSQTFSDIIVLTHTFEILGAESYTGWDMSIFCSGCVVMNYGFNYAVANLLSWNGQVYATAVVDPPLGIGSSAVTSIGAYTTGTGITANGVYTVGWVTVHVTAASGSVATGFNPGEGFGNAGTVDPNFTLNKYAWPVPEPGTAMLLALGLTGLGVMGRRNR
jgi:hypothetical protein